MPGRVSASFPPLQTSRLRLEPVTAELARAIVAGELSEVTAGRGWPHEDTSDGLAMAIRSGHPPGWLITTAGTVIGDCGTHGPPDERGCVEIGYGLAASYRGQGFGSEAVAAITTWLLGQPDVRQIRACTSAGNTASRRVLEKAGYRLTAQDADEVIYERA